MAEFDIDGLIAAARHVAGDFACSQECSAGSVGAALLSEAGKRVEPLGALLPHSQRASPPA